MPHPTRDAPRTMIFAVALGTFTYGPKAHHLVYSVDPDLWSRGFVFCICILFSIQDVESVIHSTYRFEAQLFIDQFILTPHLQPYSLHLLPSHWIQARSRRHSVGDYHHHLVFGVRGSDSLGAIDGSVRSSWWATIQWRVGPIRCKIHNQ